MIDISYSINMYNRHGDIVETGVYLHFGNASVRIADSIEDVKNLTSNIDKIVAEISGYSLQKHVAEDCAMLIENEGAVAPNIKIRMKYGLPLTCGNAGHLSVG